MKKFILIAIFFTQLFYGFCQKFGTIEGVVFDSVENTGIAYATLALLKADLGTASDKEGNFIFKNVPIGEDILKCSLIGYGTARREVIPIVYGEPTNKSLKQAMKGKIMLGGCMISPCNPHWYCKRDNVSF